ncbi:MAG: HEPN domain-containing protein [Candidatus Woesearchaeota archaeon]|nr:HEPN domain-containing protein [Candidatus Woesearchaeota archaeon]
MKRINFIQKLIEEEKILLVKESKEISESYNQKSKNSLKAAKLLYEQELPEEATSMSYYAMYHKTNSLFYLTGIKCENHAAAIILLKELFEINNEDISFAKEQRVDKQYYADFAVTKDDVKKLIEKSENFIEELDLFIDSLTEDKRNRYRNDFNKTYFQSKQI